MSKIYLLVGSRRYEGDENICAFAHRAPADALIEKLETWIKLKPGDPTERDERGWRSYDVAMASWKAISPLHAIGRGDTDYTDSFEVCELELHEGTVSV